MKNSEPEFALLIEKAGIAAWSNTGDSYFRCFTCIEDLCDFIEDKLLPKEWDAHPEGLALNDLKRLRKEAIVVLEIVRRGYLPEESEREELNRLAAEFDFQIGWWGKFSTLVRTQQAVAIFAREAFYYWENLELDEEEVDISADRSFEYPKQIPKAKLVKFQNFLNTNLKDMLGY